MPGDTLIFKGFRHIYPTRCLISDLFLDWRGHLEREPLFRCDTFGGIDNDHCDPLVVPLDYRSECQARSNDRYIPAITTTPPTNPAARATSINQLKPLSLSVHIFGGIVEQGSSLLSTGGTVCFCALGTPQDIGTRALTSNPPPPPTSGRPRCHVLYTHYTAIDMLNDDILLLVFNHYRLDIEIDWNARLGWSKLSHVCRRWRHLVFGSVFYLGIHILCTNGTPLVDTLVHLPPLPLVVDYQYATATIGARDELGIFHAFQLRDRLHRVVLRVPPSILAQLLVLMDEPFPVLEHLSLSSSGEDGTILQLPKPLLAPNLRHLTVRGIALPKKFLFLSSTVSLVTLTLTNRDFVNFLPHHLVARLRSFPQLEELSIGFSIPSPTTKTEPFQEIEHAPVTLPSLKRLTFQGISAYLNNFVAQIRAPLLEQLSITLLNQISFALSHLSHFTNTTQGLMLPIAKIIFKDSAVSIITGHGPSNFSLHVMCKHFESQVDIAARICSALRHALSSIKQLTINFEGQRVPEEWQDDVVDSTTWRELLVPFTGVRKLRICHPLAWELSCVLHWAEIGSDPEILPSLDELDLELEEEHTDNGFVSFIEARQAAGRLVLLSVLPVSRERSAPFPLVPEAPLIPYSHSLASPEYSESPPLPSREGS